MAKSDAEIIKELREELAQVKADRAYWARLSAERGVLLGVKK